MTKEVIYHLLLLMEKKRTVAIDLTGQALGIVLLHVQECKWEILVPYRHNHFVAGIVI